MTKNKKYKVYRSAFFNWYFKNQPKEQISAFLSPYLLNLAAEDAHFSLQDMLKHTKVIPSNILINGPSKKQNILTENVELIK